MVVFALFMTLVQSNIEDGLRGRVVSVYSLAFRGAMPLGNLFAGAMASVFTAPKVLVANGIVMLLVGAGVIVTGRGRVMEL